MKWQIAIDGPSGAGKSTIAKLLALKLGFVYVDTGAMYRAITLKALELKINLENESEYDFLEKTIISFEGDSIYLDGKDVSQEIRSLEVTVNVSLVSKFKTVRDYLVSMQRKIALDANVVMDGRDIGTVVLKDANLKVYLDATIEERARRRRDERISKGQEVSNLEETIEEIKVRDHKDSTREISPLRKADDAILIDTTNLSIDEVIEEITKLVLERGYRMEKKVETKALEETKAEASVVELEEKKTTKEVVKEEAKEVKKEAKEEKKEKAPKAKEEKATSGDQKDNLRESKFKDLEHVYGIVLSIDSNPADRRKEKALVLGIGDEDMLKIKKDGKLVKDGKLLLDAAEKIEAMEDVKSEKGYLYRHDFEDIKEDEGLLDLLVVGDLLELIVKKIGKAKKAEEPILLFSTKLLKLYKEIETIEKDYEENKDKIYEAKVSRFLAKGREEGKADLLLKYNGLNFFLPSLQINANDEEKKQLLDQTLEVAIIRVDKPRLRLIVSNKAALAIKYRKELEEKVAGIEVGKAYKGVVKNVETYGAFIEIVEGVDALLHVSEWSHDRIRNLKNTVKVGSKVEFKVLGKEQKGNEYRISISRKALLPDHCGSYAKDKKLGDVEELEVVEINNAGVVLKLNEGATGFLPRSEFAWEKNVFIKDYTNVGQKLKVKIIELEPARKRVIFSRKQLIENPWETLKLEADQEIIVKVVAKLKDGFKVEYANLIGYMPANSVHSMKVTDIKEGMDLEVVVGRFDPEETRFVVYKDQRLAKAPKAPEKPKRAPRGKGEKKEEIKLPQETISSNLKDLIKDQLDQEELKKLKNSKK